MVLTGNYLEGIKSMRASRYEAHLLNVRKTATTRARKFKTMAIMQVN